VSWIDSAISIISPSWAASRGNARLAARAAAARLEAYETFNRFNSNRWGRVGRTAHDAAKKTREVADWYTDAYSADAAIIPRAARHQRAGTRIGSQRLGGPLHCGRIPPSCGRDRNHLPIRCTRPRHWRVLARFQQGAGRSVVRLGGQPCPL
jgi:hypothetical protein